MFNKSNLILNGGYSSYINGKYHTFQGFEKSLEELKLSVYETLDYAARVEDKCKELQDEHWKDERLQEMKEKLDQMSERYWRGFPISEEEEKAIEEWKENHNNKMHKGNHLRGGAIGGSWEYRFVPTSIGVSGTICCQSCRGNMLRELGDELSYGSYSEYKKARDRLTEKYDCEFEFQEIG